MTLKSIDCLKLINYIENSQEFKSYILPCKKILIAYSGGQDSSSLLSIFYILSQKWKFELGIVYCDHGWTDESINTEKIFENIFQYQLPFYFVQTNPRIAQKSENTARNWRYSTFESIVYWGNYDLVLTGHSLSDKAETILFNLCRGTGLKGVSSLKSFQIFSPTSNKKLNFEYDTFLLSDVSFNSRSYFQPHFVSLLNYPKQIKINLQKKRLLVFENSYFFTGLNTFRLSLNTGKKSFILISKEEKKRLSFFQNNQRFNNCLSKYFDFIFQNRQNELNTKTKLKLTRSSIFNKGTQYKSNLSFGAYIFKFYKKKHQIKNCLALLKNYSLVFDRIQKQKTIITFFNPSLLIILYKKFSNESFQKSNINFTSFSTFLKLKSDVEIVDFYPDIEQKQFQKLLTKKQNEKILKQDLNQLVPFLNSSSIKITNWLSFRDQKKYESKNLSNNYLLLSYKQFFRSQLKPHVFSSFKLCRPLLKINRTVLFQFAKQLKLPIIFDQSNNDLSLTRNFIRKKILPLLKQVNPRVEENLYKFSQIVTIYLEQNEKIQCSSEDLDIFKP